MDILPIHLFKGSFEPVLDLLNEHNIKYQMEQVRPGVVMASGSTLEIVLSATVWASLATVLVAFIKARHGRKIVITTKNNQVIHAEGLTAKDMEVVLKNAKNIMAVDPNPNNEDSE